MLCALRDTKFLHVCADDTHGTPIQIRAEAQGVKPEDFVAGWHTRHIADFKDFNIGFDFYGSTHTEQNQQVATQIYQSLVDAGHIDQRQVEQMYCAACKRFLPDRYVRGTCPKCEKPDQYGDACEHCSATYSPEDLKDPHCAICGATPEMRSSKHYFVKLDAYADMLREWTSAQGHLQDDVRNYVDRWLQEGLRDWDISRDGPYFGFKIPGEDDKYFYVWLDAPVGYISNAWRWCQGHDQQLDSWWRSDDTKVVHFIGKDIIYFHTLFWPAMLNAAGFSLPHQVHVHGMLTAGGEKLSKSRGTFINARTYLDHLDPQALRYYFAAKLGSGIDDIDLNFADFTLRVNADLSNRIVNLLSRSLQFAGKRLDKQLGDLPDDAQTLRDEILSRVAPVREAYAKFEFGRAMKLINECADIANKYLQDEKPFQVIKTDPERARAVTTFAINAAKVIMALLKPVLPNMAAQVETMLKIPPMDFSAAEQFDLINHQVGDYQRLFERLEEAKVQALIKASAEAAAQAELASQGHQQAETAAEKIPEIDFDHFMSVELRAGLVVVAEAVPKANKLLRLVVDIGEAKPRQIFAGLRKTYAPEDLQGKMVAVVANLAPRKMRFGLSEGMVLASGEDETQLHVVEVPGSQPGDRIR